MVGEQVDDFYPKEDHATDTDRLVVRGLGREGAFSDVSFTVRAGEVLGIGGVMGSGKSEILRAFFGLDRAQGQVSIDGGPGSAKSPREAISRGIAWS